MSSLLRSLLEDEDYVYEGENAVLGSEEAIASVDQQDAYDYYNYYNSTTAEVHKVVEEDQGGEEIFDGRVFWGVNCFIMVLLIGMGIWCFWFGGKERVVEWSNLTNRSIDSDLQYQQRVRDRHEQRLAARRSTPAKRAARLQRSFQRNKVQMVVKEGDIIQTDEMSHHGGGAGGDGDEQDKNLLNNCNSMDTETTTRESSSSSPVIDDDIDENNITSAGISSSKVHTLEEGTLLPLPPATNEEKKSASDEYHHQFCLPVTGAVSSPEKKESLTNDERAPTTTTERGITKKEDDADAEQQVNQEPPLPSPPMVVAETAVAVMEEGILAAEAMEEGILTPPPLASTTNHNNETDQPTTTNDGNEPSSLLAPPPSSADGLLLCSGGGDNMSTLSDHPTGHLVLRPGDAPVPPPPSSKERKMVPNCCAVCLGSYEVGDTVVWSCNPECSHAFHLECIMEWLMKIHDGGTPCPCCRQEFTSWETDRQERKIKWAAGHTFDMGAVSLR